jgi:hypothetical protein
VEKMNNEKARQIEMRREINTKMAEASVLLEFSRKVKRLPNMNDMNELTRENLENLQRDFDYGVTFLSDLVRLKASIDTAKENLADYFSEKLSDAMKTDDVDKFSKLVKIMMQHYRNVYLDDVYYGAKQNEIDKQAIDNTFIKTVLAKIFMEAALGNKLHFVKSMLNDNDDNVSLTWKTKPKSNLFHEYLSTLTKSSFSLAAGFKENTKADYSAPQLVLDHIKNSDEEQSKARAEITCLMYSNYIKEQLQNGESTLALKALRKLSVVPEESHKPFLGATLEAIKRSFEKYADVDTLIESVHIVTPNFKNFKYDQEKICDRYKQQVTALIRKNTLDDERKAIKILFDLKNLRELSPPVVTDEKLLNDTIQTIKKSLVKEVRIETLKQILNNKDFTFDKNNYSTDLEKNVLIYEKILASDENLRDRCKQVPKTILDGLDELKKGTGNMSRQTAIATCIKDIQASVEEGKATGTLIKNMLGKLVETHNNIRNSLHGRPGKFMGKGSNTANGLEELIRKTCEGLNFPSTNTYLTKDKHNLELTIPRDLVWLLNKVDDDQKLKVARGAPTKSHSPGH